MLESLDEERRTGGGWVENEKNMQLMKLIL